MPRGEKPYELAEASGLARLRIAAGLTQAAAAEAIGMSKHSLGNVERGSAPVSDEKLGRMAEVYGVGLEKVARAYRATRMERLQGMVKDARRAR